MSQNLATKLDSGQFVITAEIAPPASGQPTEFLESARLLAGLVDAVNVTDAAGARVAMSSLAASVLLMNEGFDPILQMTCRDRNRIAIQGDLLGASALGVRNLLVLHGDNPEAGDHPDAKAVFDLSSREVVEAARRMRDEGVLLSGRELKARPDFFLGSADTPRHPEPGGQPFGLLSKKEAGAQFIQTQFVFDPDMAERYIAQLAEFRSLKRLHIIFGVGPIRSAKSARWMNSNLFGVSVPEHVIARLDAASNPEEEGIAICAELMRAFSDMPGVAGVHLMSPTGVPSIRRAILASGLRAAA
jgi:methylenetetrahydrofolate reductase (NADPH)